MFQKLDLLPSPGIKMGKIDPGFEMLYNFKFSQASGQCPT
jgi:hypothetical protein